MDCGLWWFDQAQANYRYVGALHQKDSSRQQQAAKQMVDHAVAWGQLTRQPAAENLMKFHVGAMKRLADSAFSKHRRGIELGLEEAIANERDQTAFYLKAFSRFPEKEWADAFMLYLTAVAGYTLALASDDLAEFRKQSDLSREVKNALAILWCEIVDANGIA